MKVQASITLVGRCEEALTQQSESNGETLTGVCNAVPNE